MKPDEMLDIVESEAFYTLRQMGAAQVPCWLPEEMRVEIDLSSCPEVDMEEFINTLRGRLSARGEILDVWHLDGRIVAVSEPKEDRL